MISLHQEWAWSAFKIGHCGHVVVPTPTSPFDSFHLVKTSKMGLFQLPMLPGGGCDV